MNQERQCSCNGCKNILDSCGNDLVALAAAFTALFNEKYNAEDLATLAAFFTIVGDNLALYATQKTRLCSNTSNNIVDIDKAEI